MTRGIKRLAAILLILLILQLPQSVSANTYEQELAYIVSQAEASLSDVYKALFVHDYFCVNYEYDKSGEIHTKEELFTQGRGVCQAYAEAYLAVMNKLSIPCVLMYSSGMNHVWNAVLIDGNWYHVDVSWDDSTPDRVYRANHSCFLQSDVSLLENDHYGWTSTQGIICSDTRYDQSLWRKVSSAFTWIDGSCYYQHDKGVYLFDLASLSGELIYSYEAYWYVEGRDGSYWMDCYSGFGSYDGRLYYNDNHSIYTIDPKKPEAFTLFNASPDGNQIYGIRLRGSTLTYELAADPTIEETERGQLELSEASTAPTFTPIPIIYGDSNRSGAVDASDAALILRCLVGLENDESVDKTAADVNVDKQVDAADAALILRKLVGLIASYPAEDG